MAETIHIGRKISRIRELRGMKQDALAAQLGISQQAISKLEQSENVEDETLEKVAKILNVSPEAIKNFSEEAVFNNINTFHDNSSLNDYSSLLNYQCTFNPIDKIVELYERLLKSEQEKVELLKNSK
ncbi:helix-turn-helix domain-containing protein [Mucilaginibacter daejeonensis]|uniref:helix-turn-helix domain-containing protein n=1 Tax=Mucilaginibacter daejeonensis TaxID=398049 RepID=UPI001D171965|nr:helix-turn-helix transcriptional regulator [Mucilaginibacter daejeonensis]UEG54883.1 helix-turn-helix domain-containing protein [Mucilaginibacter daejeonensis]